MVSDFQKLVDTHFKFQLHKSHHRLIKNILTLLEDIREGNYSIGYDYPKIRKKVLDSINDETRTLEALLSEHQQNQETNNEEKI